MRKSAEVAVAMHRTRKTIGTQIVDSASGDCISRICIGNTFSDLLLRLYWEATCR
jgi:hypothetical protein